MGGIQRRLDAESQLPGFYVQSGTRVRHPSEDFFVEAPKLDGCVPLGILCEWQPRQVVRYFEGRLEIN